MENTKQLALYAYFGELGIFEDDIPGHTFYQLGLIDSISEKYGIESFDFYNYIDQCKLDNKTMPNYPTDGLGEVFNKYTDKLILNYRIDFETDLIDKIINKQYSKIFLKARFRNLSTLQKKIFDADRFEKIINVAIKVGYDPSDIVIVDTDLSLSKEFLSTISELGITREIPSITMPGISKGFIDSCLMVHAKNKDLKERAGLVYYGNLSFDNYKEGHSKNPIINSIIDKVDDVEKFDGSKFNLTVICKNEKTITSWISNLSRTSHISRQNRHLIWQALSGSLVSINVSKDLYLKEGFVPARVYESIIFGVIPVSYKSPKFHPALSFENEHEFFEICKFLEECTPSDYFKLLVKISNSL